MARSLAASPERRTVAVSAGNARPLAGWLHFAPWIVGIAGLAALVWFDLGPNLPSNDDWMFAWSVKRLATGHGVQKVPDLAPLGLVQLFWGTLVSLGHVDYRLLRLSALPFCLLAVFCTHRLALNLGASRFWASVAACGLLTAPLFLALSTTFMSEVFYVGLLMAVALTAETWVSRGRAAPICVGLVALAFLERQTAVYVPAAITIALLLARRRRTVSAREWIYVAGMWLAIGSLFLVVELAGLDRATSGRGLAILQHLAVDNLFLTVWYLPAMLGLFSTPFILALFRRRPAEPTELAVRRRGRPRIGVILTGTLIPLAIAQLVLLSLRGRLTIPGNYLTLAGLGPTILSGTKPNVYPAWLFLAIEMAATAALIGLLFNLRVGMSWRRLQPGVALMLLLGIAQLVPLLIGRTFDRYYLPAVVVVLPVIALMATRTRPVPGGAATVAAVLTMVGGLLLYVIGEQDYQSWQSARDAAARQAFATTPPALVQAGFEANGVYFELPGYERYGLPDRAPILNPELLPSIVGPAHPVVRLEYASPDDPRPGVSYRSIASGKIVIIGGHAAY